MQMDNGLVYVEHHGKLPEKTAFKRIKISF